MSKNTMTVNEFIERLRKIDPTGEARVMYYTPDYEDLEDYADICPVKVTRVKSVENDSGYFSYFDRAQPQDRKGVFLAVIL